MPRTKMIINHREYSLYTFRREPLDLTLCNSTVSLNSYSYSGT